MTPQRKPSHREGALRMSDAKAELLFVTLDKSEGGFSPTTSYRDYAISREVGHADDGGLFERFAALLAT